METLRDGVRTASVSVASVFMRQVYQWMTVGLLVTAGSAVYVANSPAILQALFGNTIGFIALAMGAFLSSVLLVYTGASVMQAFLTAAGTFAAMSVYGTVTRRDLTQMGSFLTMGLIGLIIAMLVNLFLQSTMLEFVISAIGVLIFTGLTAYDTQRIRAFGENAPLGDTVAVRRGALLGALTLYLDFINLFLMLLRLMGDRR